MTISDSKLFSLVNFFHSLLLVFLSTLSTSHVPQVFLPAVGRHASPHLGSAQPVVMLPCPLCTLLVIGVCSPSLFGPLRHCLAHSPCCLASHYHLAPFPHHQALLPTLSGPLPVLSCPPSLAIRSPPYMVGPSSPPVWPSSPCLLAPAL